MSTTLTLITKNNHCDYNLLCKSALCYTHYLFRFCYSDKTHLLRFTTRQFLQITLAIRQKMCNMMKILKDVKLLTEWSVTRNVCLQTPCISKLFKWAIILATFSQTAKIIKTVTPDKVEMDVTITLLHLRTKQ